MRWVEQLEIAVLRGEAIALARRLRAIGERVAARCPLPEDGVPRHVGHELATLADDDFFAEEIDRLDRLAVRTDSEVAKVYGELWEIEP
ncbi:MAG: hypothetical protein AAGD38_14005 [Acidobacteriota bacterium]